METNKNIELCIKRNFFRTLVSSVFIILITSINSFASPPEKLFFYALKNLILPILYPLSNNEWILDNTVGNVDLYYKIIECKGSNTVLLKFYNRNNYPVNIVYRELFVTQQVSTKAPGMSGTKNLILSPGETSASDCEDLKNKNCIILAEKAIPAYKATIVQFEFKDIHVNKTP